MVKLVEQKKMGLPLKGKRIVVTRPEGQNKSLVDEIESLGGEALELPLIKVSAHCNPEVLDEVFEELGGYDWLIFTSANGVKYFFNFFFKKFKDIRCIGGVRIGCVGETTKLEVEKWLLQVDVIPERSTAEELGRAIMEFENLDSLKVLVVTGNLNKDTLPKLLEEEGRAIVDTCPVYRTEQTVLEKAGDVKVFKSKGADAIVFASGSAVESFAAQAKVLQLGKNAQHPTPVSMGPSTSESIKKLGMERFFEAENQSIESLIDLLIEKL